MTATAISSIRGSGLRMTATSGSWSLAKPAGAIHARTTNILTRFFVREAFSRWTAVAVEFDCRSGGYGRFAVRSVAFAWKARRYGEAKHSRTKDSDRVRRERRHSSAGANPARQLSCVDASLNCKPILSLLVLRFRDNGSSGAARLRLNEGQPPGCPHEVPARLAAAVTPEGKERSGLTAAVWPVPATT